tara:strand:- start:2165 stop:3127 length:963 start_codon:yes stop_codon:yes gene_type:complete
MKSQKFKTMKKLKVFAAFSALVFLMSSCVYSLFPIYTEDTLVYLPELVGKWFTDPNDPDDYIEFTPMGESNNEEDDGITMNEDSDGDQDTYSYAMQGDGWSIKSDDPITVEIDGKEVSDPVKVKAYYDELFSGMKTDLEKGVGEMAGQLDSAINSEGNEFGKMLKDLGNGVGELGKALKETEAKFKGSAYLTREQSYKMIAMNDGDKEVYQVHVVKIGEDYFLDIYPLPEFTDSSFGENMFPVHSFMKMNLEEGKLKLTLFDLKKLNELFERNLVRLRHEMVDGTVLITAQPKDIQKFLSKYSNDERVFEEGEIYTKMAQ